jgi:hypothetical protein
MVHREQNPLAWLTRLLILSDKLVAHTFCDPIYGGYLENKYGVALGV